MRPRALRIQRHTTSGNLNRFLPEIVSKAQGGINVYANENRAEYYGSILSIEVQHGASALRPTAVGIAALIQQ